MQATITGIFPSVDEGEEVYEVRFKVKMNKCDYNLLVGTSRQLNVEISILPP